MASTELSRLAHAFSRRLDRQARPPATDGTFAVVLDDAAEPHYFTWIRTPSDSAGSREVEFAFRRRFASEYREPIVSAMAAAPLAVEAELLRDCR